ncbi:IS66 family insertion sequence element accessory protein TnpB [Bradyrhizobium barranii]|uniref:IS66 family insertion sequence element accessory protein TnpB n=1 Tax=Bradyrhizobium barranii subsp. barranii TaxID=2823807 RepID=A0A7Z0QNV2_9BRAD|nr:IS66 family insertion sequence element accessory protein TnpB [Bradyrhizobium barranii]
MVSLRLSLCDPWLVREPGRFEWPQISDGVMHLTRVQFEALFEGLNWKRVGERIVATPAAAN